MKRILLVLIILGTLLSPVLASSDKPGAGVTVRPARASWNTGYFQEVLVRKGLEELGYRVKRVKELSNPLFYQAVALGDIDYWTNGWFPNHDGQLPKNFYDKADRYGYVMKAGGLQGYLVSKKEAEELNIQSLADFKRPEVRAVFDSNGDGKADLTACPPGWGCEGVITHHLDVYDLADHIKPIKAAYAASMAEVLVHQKQGDPIFFYTWAPNWTIFKLKPGEDVVWINVPKIMPKASQEAGRERMTVTGLEGAVSDPVKLGFVVSDIQIVANKEFTRQNPAAQKFFEVFTLPLEDVNEQNTRMNEGEKSPRDINRHADEWIAKNQTLWQQWLTVARSAAH